MSKLASGHFRMRGGTVIQNTNGNTVVRNTLADALDELSIEIATTPEQIVEAKRLRYLVYCEDRNFLAGDNGIEEDEFDAFSRHILVRGKATGEVYGTVRVVYTRQDVTPSIPMQNVCAPYILQAIPFECSAEISRFAVRRDRMGLSNSAAALVRMALIRGIVEVSMETGLTHWCATMERTLLRLLRMTGICFRPIGEPFEYHGLRQAALWPLKTGFSEMQQNFPEIWSFLTNAGKLLPVSTDVDLAHQTKQRVEA